MVKTKMRGCCRLHPMAALFICGCIVAAVIISGMSQSVAIADYQYELAELRAQFEEAQRIGQYLQLQAAQLQSLDRIEALARNQLGMVEPTSVRTIVLNPESIEPATTGSLEEKRLAETPNRYLVAASRLLARLLPALDQAEAGKLGDR